MMNAEQLSRVGEKLVKRCGSRDPFEIARQLGINVMICEMYYPQSALSLRAPYRQCDVHRHQSGCTEGSTPGHTWI